MREVLVVSSYRFANERDEIARGLYSYARQIDNRGGEGVTNIVSSLTRHPNPTVAREAGQRVMVSYVGYPGLRTAAVLAQTLEAFERAVGWAGRSGTLVIGLGHGVVHTQDLYVAMAPLRFFPAHRVHFEDVERVLAGDVPESSLDERRLLLLRIARLIRQAHLTRVDFLSCQVGVGQRGQDFLNVVARVFATRVRGLRGDLCLRWREGTSEAGAWVPPSGQDCSAPRGRRPGSPFGVEYTDTIPMDDGLWRSGNP